MLTSTCRICKFAAHGFWRNIWLSLMTVSILMLTILSFNVFVVVNVLARQAMRSVEERIDVSVYFKSGASDELVRSVRSYLLSFPQVMDVRLINPERAFERFTKQHQGDPEILAALRELESNPLGATLVVRAASAADYPLILQSLEQPAYREFIEEKNFDDHKVLISKISSWSEKVQNFGIALSSVFAFIALMIVFNSIRVAIYTHREEISIMKLVGASSGFVRLPFLLEGVFYSVIAMGVAIGLIFPVVHFLDPALAGFFDGANVSVAQYFRSDFVKIFSGQFAALAGLTIISSSLAMRRYLRV